MDFPAHNGDVVSISVSPDGNTYVTGSVDKSCRLWDIREQTPKQTFFGHEADVNSVCVSMVTIIARNNDVIKYHVIVSLSVPSERSGFCNRIGRQIRAHVRHSQRPAGGAIQTAKCQ